MSKKKVRFLITLLAVMLCMTAFSSVAYAGGGPENEPSPMPTMTSVPTPTSSPNSFTPDGTGTVLDNATDADGKEFYTILAPDENVFYLVIDRQRNTENVYFLDAVTVKDLLSLAETAKSDELVIITPKPEPTPESTPQSEQKSTPESQNNAGGIAAVFLIIGIIAVSVFCFFKFRKPKQSAKGKSDLDEYDFGEDEDEPDDVGDTIRDADAETEDDEQ